MPSSPNLLQTSDIEPEQETDDEFQVPAELVEESDDEFGQYEAIADSSLLEPVRRQQIPPYLQHSTTGQTFGSTPAKSQNGIVPATEFSRSKFPYSAHTLQAMQSTSRAGSGLSGHPIPPNPIQIMIGPPPSDAQPVQCKLCSKLHSPGKCSLRNVEVERCPACGYHHFHLQRACPLLQDEEYVEAMYRRLNESTEDRQVVKAAKSYLTGVRNDYAVRQKRTAGDKRSTGPST